MTKIFFPFLASAVAKLMTVVVFPTPPFWFITDIIDPATIYFFASTISILESLAVMLGTSLYL